VCVCVSNWKNKVKEQESLLCVNIIDLICCIEMHFTYFSFTFIDYILTCINK
jgi:hypothetical protein